MKKEVKSLNAGLSKKRDKKVSSIYNNSVKLVEKLIVAYLHRYTAILTFQCCGPQFELVLVHSTRWQC